MSGRYSDWIAPLEENFGDDLRMAAQFAPDEYRHLYLRDDIRERYTAEVLDEIRRELIVLLHAKARIETIAHAGECRYLLYRLDDAVVFLFPRRDYSGRFVSLSPESVATHAGIADLCSY